MNSEARSTSTTDSPPHGAVGEAACEPDDRSDTLLRRFPGLVCDLDGVVYRGAQAVPHAVECLTHARRSGAHIVFATNNASRAPAVVADALRDLGLALDDADVLTSSIAGARRLAQVLPDGAPVLAVGGPGVADALRAAGLHPVAASDAARQRVAAVLQGYGAEVTAAELGEVAYAIQGGARWVATNDDLTLPTDRGVAPGNGALVAAVRRAVDIDPTVVGKPGPLLYDLAQQSLGTDAEHTLGIGDRLETDVAGAHAAGLSALHVLTGVHGPGDLARAAPDLRPRFVAEDLRTLHEPYPEPRRTGPGQWTDGQISAAVSGSGDAFRIDFSGADSSSPMSWIRQVRLGLCVVWEAVDAEQVTAEQAAAALPPR